LGDRGTVTGRQLWDAIQNKNISIKKVATDYWKPYENFVPKDLHIQSKAETFTVEGYNSLFRHFLARSVENQNATAKAWRCQIFCNPVNAKMEQWTTSYIKLTMPN